MRPDGSENRSTCRSCGRPVIWARLNTGAWAPLDPERHDGGQMVLLDGRRCHPVEPGVRYGHDVQVRRHRSHVSTCGLAPPARAVSSVVREVSAEMAGQRDRLAQVRRLLQRRPAGF